jgi:catechol 2,3-dioxygenase-like lactoylglutathione lyase family enzyme
MTSKDDNTPGARLRVTSVTIGTSQPSALADFYARLLGLPVTADEPPLPDDPVRGGWAQIRPPAPGLGPTLNFEYEQHFTPTTWPSVADGQNATQHLDVAVDDLAAAVEWALAQGAVLADVQPQDSVRVLLDPDGHPFCLFEAPQVFDD